MDENKIVRVGVAVIVRRSGHVLMGLRKGSHGAGTWAFPGGHIEVGEKVTEAARRELYEETGMSVPPVGFRKLTYTNDVFKREKKHYITLYVMADLRRLIDEIKNQEPRIMEPDKCEQWKWVNKKPGRLFIPARNFMKQERDLCYELFGRYV